MESQPPVFFEKSDTVLWALMPEGILLHNFATQQYIELRGVQHLVWAYLDGVHTLQDVVRLLNSHASGADLNNQQIEEIVQATFEHLKMGQFIKCRHDTPNVAADYTFESHGLS